MKNIIIIIGTIILGGLIVNGMIIGDTDSLQSACEAVISRGNEIVDAIQYPGN